MDGNLFLQWLSHRQNGSLSGLTYSTAAFMEGPPRTQINTARAYLQRLEALGHIDLLRADNKWSICPPMLTNLPGASAFAIAVGNRTKEFEDRLEMNLVLHKVKQPKVESGSPPDPEALLLEYDNESALEEIVEEEGAVFLPCAAIYAADQLSKLQAGSLSAGPNTYGTPIQMFSPYNNDFLNVDIPRNNGLFRQLINRRYQYWMFESERWFSTTYAEGVCLIKSRSAGVYLQLRIAEVSDDLVGILRVDEALPLPIQHRRVLTLCSGLSPTKLRSGYWTYHNVPVSIARLVAKSIRQKLTIRF